MTSASLRLRLALYLLRRYTPARLVASLRYHWHGETRSVGMRRDLMAPLEPPEARMSITVRPIEDGDPGALLALGSDDELLEEENARRYRYRMLAAGLPGCYVAVTAEGEPCCMQWLLTAESNARIRWALGPLFPRLDGETVLLEGAYTPPRFRGNRIMPTVLAQIAERGRDFGARGAVTFIGEDNAASIKGARRAGFEPHSLRVERWRRFRRTVTFESLPMPIER